MRAPRIKKPRLKICPFCAAKAVLVEINAGSPNSPWMVTCPNGHRATGEGPELAIRSWNRRFNGAPFKRWMQVAWDWMQFVGVLAGIYISFFFLLMILLLLTVLVIAVFSPDYTPPDLFTRLAILIRAG